MRNVVHAEPAPRAPHASAAKARASIRAAVKIPLVFDGVEGTAIAITFHGLADDGEHMALAFGAWREHDPVPVRLHSECLTGDLFGSARCDCGPQLKEAMGQMLAEGGLILYMRQEGRGIGLYQKLDAYGLQDAGLDTYEANERLRLPADGRSYRAAADMLAALEVGRVSLLSNNPDKARQLRAHGVTVARTRATGVYVTPHNRRYLATKVSRTRHTLRLEVKP